MMCRQTERREEHASSWYMEIDLHEGLFDQSCTHRWKHLVYPLVSLTNHQLIAETMQVENVLARALNCILKLHTQCGWSKPCYHEIHQLLRLQQSWLRGQHDLQVVAQNFHGPRWSCCAHWGGEVIKCIDNGQHLY